MVQLISFVVHRKFMLGSLKGHIKKIIGHLPEQLKFRDTCIIKDYSVTHAVH